MGLFRNILNRLTLRKGLDDAQWSDIADIGDVGQVSLKAHEAVEKQLKPKECYELSVAVNACVNAICRNLSKAKIRLFRRDGTEIIDGRVWQLLHRPLPGITGRRFIWELASWYNITGEIAVRKIKSGGDVTGLGVLDPLRLFIHRPHDPPRDRSGITEWRYDFHDGKSEYFANGDLVFDAMFNPNHPVRGLSPLVTGAVEVGTGYALSRYNKSFFENGAVPSHVVILPDGTSNQQRKDIERRYKEEFGTYRNNAHKVMVMAGRDAKIETLEQPFQDGAFMELRKSVLQQVAMLYRVPAIEAGLYDKTRFDTAAEERKLFVESTLMPQMEVFSEVLQSQLVDPHFAFDSTAVAARPEKLSKAMDEAFEQARVQRQDSRLLVMLDPDTLPIMGAVKAAQISVAKDFRETLMLSARETADYFGIDIDERKEREDIWIDRNRMNVSNPTMNQLLAPTPPQAQEKPSGESKKPQKGKAGKERAKASRIAAAKSLRRSVRRLKKFTLDAMDAGEQWLLKDADALTDGSEAAKRAVRLIHHDLKPLMRRGDKDEIKRWFNTLDAAEYITA